MLSTPIAIGCDHAGLELKRTLMEHLSGLGVPTVDFGTESSQPVDYPDIGERVSDAVSSGKVARGILICGTGIGMSIVSNKFPGVRASLCHDPFTARMSRLHNDSNVLVLGSRVTDESTALEIVRVWLETGFEGGRHARRVGKIKRLEERLNDRSNRGEDGP